jgi:hypothetical protein
MVPKSAVDDVIRFCIGLLCDFGAKAMAEPEKWKNDVASARASSVLN